MLDKIIKYLPITTCIILFLFLSGGLYLICFWTNFHVDISNLVGLMEIPKSFITPFTISIGFGVLLSFTTGTTLTPFHERLKTYDRTSTSKYLWLILDLAIIIYPIIFVYLYLLLKKYMIFWALGSMIFAMLIVVKIRSSNLVTTLFKNAPACPMGLFIIVLTPIMSFAMGKAVSIKIYYNKEIKYIKIINTKMQNEISDAKDSISLKFVGFLGDKFIVSSLDNKRVIILNQSAFDGVELIDPPKKK